MADFKFHEPVMGRRAFVGGSLAASSLAFLAACGKKGGSSTAGSASGATSGSIVNYYAARAYENIARRITGHQVPLMRI